MRAHVVYDSDCVPLLNDEISLCARSLRRQRVHSDPCRVVDHTVRVLDRLSVFSENPVYDHAAVRMLWSSGQTKLVRPLSDSLVSQLNSAPR